MNTVISSIIHLLLFAAICIAGVFAAASASDSAYSLKIDLPPEVVLDVTVTDVLPAGLSYNAGSLSISGVAANPAQSITGPNDGSEPTWITWSFGLVDNSNNQDILIKFEPTVTDAANNRDGITLEANWASLHFTDISGTAHTISGRSSPVKLVEPDLDIKMAPSPTDEKSAIYTVSIGHTALSHSDAFNCGVLITLPPGLVYHHGSAEVVSGPHAEVDAYQGEISWYFDHIDQSWSGGRPVVLEFRGSAEGGGNPGEVEAALTWKSAPGENEEARRYTKYCSAPAVTHEPGGSPGINVVADVDRVEAGRVLTYTIIYANTGEGGLHGVLIRETPDSNTALISSSPISDIEDGCRWTIGDLAPGESGSIEVAVRVDPGTAEGTVLKNTVEISCDEGVSASSVAETAVKGVRSKVESVRESEMSPDPSLNASNSSQTGGSGAGELSVDLEQNRTENTTEAISRFDALTVPEIEGNDTELIEAASDANATCEPLPVPDVSTPINESDMAGPPESDGPEVDVGKLTGGAADEAEGSPSGTGAVCQTYEVDKEIYTISFEDGTEVDVVFEKDSLMMDASYVELRSNEPPEGSSRSEIDSPGHQTPPSPGTAAAAEPETEPLNQTSINLSQTELPKAPPGGSTDLHGAIEETGEVPSDQRDQPNETDSATDAVSSTDVMPDDTPVTETATVVDEPVVDEGIVDEALLDETFVDAAPPESNPFEEGDDAADPANPEDHSDMIDSTAGDGCLPEAASDPPKQPDP